MNRTATLGARLRLDPSGFSESLDAAGRQSQDFAGDLNRLGNRAQRDLSQLSSRFTGDLSRMTGRASSELSRVGRQFSSNVRQMGGEMQNAGASAGNAAAAGGNKWVDLAAKATVATAVIEGGKAVGGFLIDQGKGALEQEVMIDSVARGLASVSDGSETVAEQMKNIAEAAKMPGTGFQEIAQGSLKLQAVNVSAKESRDALVEFGNALANVGAGKAELEGITDILTGMFGDQEVTSETIDSLAGLYPKIRTMLPNIDASSPDSFLKGVVAELRTLPRASGNAKDAMDNLSDAYEAFRNKISKGKINTSVTEAVNASAEFMEAEGFGAKLDALKKGVGKTFNEISKPDTGFEKYEISAEEIAKRKQKKEEDAAKVKERALKKASDLMQEQVDQLELQREIAEAIASKDEKRQRALETQLAIMKEGKKLAEEQKITEQQAAELIERRINSERRLKEADPAKASNRKKIQEEEEIAALRDKGKNKKADKLVEERTVRDREEQLRETGFTEEEARHIAKEEAKRRAKEQDLQKRGGRARIRGAKAEPTPQGIGSETHVFQQGDQDGDEPIFQPTGMKWKPRLLRTPKPPAPAPETKPEPAPDTAPTPPPTPGAAPAPASPPAGKPAPAAPSSPLFPSVPDTARPDTAPPPPPGPVSLPAPRPPEALLPPPVPAPAPPPSAPDTAPPALPPPPAAPKPPASPGPLPRREKADAPSDLDWKPRLLRKPDGSAVSDEAPSAPSALDWKPRLLRNKDGSPPAAAPDEPIFRDGAIAGQPEPPASQRRTIRGAGSKRPDNSPAPGVGDPALIPQTNQSATPIADLILEAKKQTNLLQTIASGGSVADKTRAQSSN